MTTTSTRYTAADRALTDVLAAVPADGWAALSPCEDWTARDALGHLIDTQRDFLQQHDLDPGDRPDLGTDPLAAWRRHADRVVALVSDEAVTSTAFDGHFGPTTVGATLEQFYVWDMLVHRWDIARAAGVDARLTDAELDAIERGADSFGDALYLDGICRPGVRAPQGADRGTRVLARLGRAA